MARRDRNPYWGRKIAITLILALIFLTAAIYAAGFLYFKDRFLPGTMLNGYDVSFRTAAQAEEILGREVQAYVLEIDTMNNGVESITAEEAGLHYASDGSVGELLEEQNRQFWYLSLMQTRKLSTGREIRLSEELLGQAVDSLRCMDPQNVVQPVNASLQDTGNGYVVTPEVEGNALYRDKVLELIRTAMLQREPVVNLEESGCYKKPLLYRDDEVLIENCSMMNRIQDVVITYDFARTSETVDKSVFQDWIKVDSEGLYGFDKKKVTAFVQSLAEKYDTVGKERTFRTYDGRHITTSGGNYGWTIGVEQETAALIQDIENGVSRVKEPVYTSKALSRDENDIGNTYIEVDLTHQYMVYYRDGNVIAETPVVTGTRYFREFATPVGCFKVLEEQSPALIFENGEYAEVAYNLPFYSREISAEEYRKMVEEEDALQSSGSVFSDEELLSSVEVPDPVRPNLFDASALQGDSVLLEYSLHDASWRQDWASDAYELEGTTGSVDVPPSWMERLCEFVTVDTAVVVYE